MANIAKIMELYTAYFNRAADKAGVDYWANEMDTKGWTLDGVANSFAQQTEYTALYAGKTNAEIVALVYKNVLNRDADAGGAAYWEADLTAGNITVSQLIQAVVNAAIEMVSGSYKNAIDAAIVNNKTAVSQYYYDNNRNDKDISLSAITEATSTVDAAKATLDTVILAESKTNPDAILLTTGADVITGTALDDTINAYVGTNTVNGNNVDTMTSIDIIDGGAGTDTLTIQQSSTTNVNGATVANVENIVYTQFGTQAFNMSNVSGLKSFTNKGSIAATDLTAVGNIIDITAKNVNAQTTELTYNASAVTGLTDTQKIILDNATNNAKIDFNDASIETYAITTTGSASKVQLDNIGTTVKTVTVDGDKDLTLSFLDATATAEDITSFNASTFTGNLTVDLASNITASKMAVKTGSGNDKVTFTNYTKDDTFDLGEGNDTLVITTLTTDTTAGTFTGVETMRLSTGSNVDASLYGKNATSLVTLSLGERDNADTDTITLRNANDATFANIAFDTMDGTTDAAIYDNATVILNSGVATDNKVNLVFSNTNAQGAHVRIADDVQVTVATISVDKVEKINIITSDLGLNNSIAANDSGLVITTLTSDKLKSLTITSDSLVTITNALDDSINSIDASAATAGIVIDGSKIADADTLAANQTLTITTGAGDDTITGLAADVITTTISLGAGKDTLTLDGSAFHDTATAGIETMTIDAGAGNDTIDVSASTTLATEGTITVTLGEGVDTLKISGATTQTGITVTDFVVGAGGDKIDFATNSSFNGTAAMTAYVETVGGAGDNLTSGMIVYTGGNANSLAIADVVSALNTKLQGDTTDDNEAAYIIIGDGTNAGLYLYLESDALEAIAAADLTHIATLNGVTDVSKLSVDNFTDFLA